MSSSGEHLKGTWRTALGKVYLAAEDFEDGQEMTVTIASVTREEVIDPGTKQPKKLITLHFENTPRCMALNVTNARRISEITGTPRVEKWVGQKIVLNKEEAKAFGKIMPTIRVKEQQG